MKKTILLLFVSLLLLNACFYKSNSESLKKTQSDDRQKSLEAAKNLDAIIAANDIGETKPKFEPEKSYNMDLTDYKKYGELRPGYELGYDDNYHAYLTDKKTWVQIVFLCSSYESKYVKEDFLHHYDEAISENRDLENAFTSVINWCKQNTIKQEAVFDEYFGYEIERYYVSYKNAYSLFHI